jgi:hypothetical protein
MPAKAKKDENSPQGEDTKKKPVKRGRKPKAAPKAKKVEDKAPVRKPLPKKLPIKRVAEKAEEKKTASPIKEVKEKRSPGKGKKVMPIVITFVVTAIVVGGPLYYWSVNAGKGDLSEIQKDARETRVSFEQRIEQMMDKLTGVEAENEELKQKQEELAKQAELLKGAKKEFYSPDLGLSFEYPAIFGNVTIEFEQAATGTMFKGSFSNTESLSFVGLSEDYVPEVEAISSSSTINLVDNWGFNDSRGDYFYYPAFELDEQYYIEPIKVLDLGGVEALLVDASSFDNSEDEDSELPMVELGAPIVALVNLDGENYPSATFLNNNLEELPQEDFETIVESILVE